MPDLHFARLEEFRKRWVWFAAIGASLVVLGIFALSSTIIATLATVTFIGSLMFVGGILQLAHAFTCKNWTGFFVDVLSGILYVVVGFMLAANPGAGALALSLLIAMFLLIGGIARIVVGLVHRVDGWGWLLFHGIVNILLAFSIWSNWPESGVLVIGLFVGIDMLLTGLSLLMLGLSIRSLPHGHAPRESSGQLTVAS